VSTTECLFDAVEVAQVFDLIAWHAGQAGELGECGTHGTDQIGLDVRDPLLNVRVESLIRSPIRSFAR
jgi:hypothetical protein